MGKRDTLLQMVLKVVRTNSTARAALKIAIQIMLKIRTQIHVNKSAIHVR